MSIRCASPSGLDDGAGLPAVPPAERRVPGTILVVEDEPEILAPLSHSLRRAGYLVFEAEDGLTACRMIGSHHPDLILLDILLPDLDGWEVCRMLRQHPEPRIATTPVIMLTALNSPGDKLHGLQLGADAYLSKPYAQQEVLLLGGKLIERHRRQAELEDRFARVHDDLQQHRELHSLMFHELRNQLTILHGYTQVLDRSAAGHDPACLDAIHRSSSYLQHLAEDFLLIRKLRDGVAGLPADPLDLPDLLGEIAELYAPAAQARGMRLLIRRAGEPRAVTANRPALRIILSALVDNAVKYGPAQSTVELVCEYGERHFALAVCDEGAGVAPEDRAHLFQQFYRGTERIGGSGLGLYGVRVLSRTMGGDAEVDERCGTGFCLRVWLPLSPPARQSAA